MYTLLAAATWLWIASVLVVLVLLVHSVFETAAPLSESDHEH